MKTAMQELIELIVNNKTRLDIIEKNQQMWIEKERKQHETTFHRGINIGAFNPELDIEGRKESAKHYYESTFVRLNNQNK